MTGVLRARVGGAWVDITGGSGTDEVWIGPDDPAATLDPTAELWFDSDDEPAAADSANYWNSAWGAVAAPVKVTTAQNNIGISGTDITGLSATPVLVAGRRYQITMGIPAINATNSAVVVNTRIADGAGNELQRMVWSTATTSQWVGPVVVATYDAVVNGPFTFKGVAWVTTGTINLNFSATQPGTLTVEDIGPVTRAAVNPPAGQPTIATAGNALGVVAKSSALSGNAINASAPVPAAGVDLTYPATFTAITGRRYKLIFRIAAVSGTAAAGGNFKVQDAANSQVGDGQTWIWVGGTYAGSTLTSYLDGDGTTKTVRGVCSSVTTGTLSIYPNDLVIEDVGPNQAPALPIPDTPPGWTPLALLDGWTVDTGPPGYRKIGDVVYLRGAIQHVTTTGKTGVPFALPVGFRPTDVIRFQAGAHTVNVGGSYLARVDMGANGNFNINGYSGTINLPCVYLNGMSFSVTP